MAAGLASMDVSFQGTPARPFTAASAHATGLSVRFACKLDRIVHPCCSPLEMKLSMSIRTRIRRPGPGRAAVVIKRARPASSPFPLSSRDKHHQRPFFGTVSSPVIELGRRTAVHAALSPWRFCRTGRDSCIVEPLRQFSATNP